MAKARFLAVFVLGALLLLALTPLTALGAVPDTPTNLSPADTTTDISLTPTLYADNFTDPDTGSTHAFSQWQVNTVANVDTTPLFDSGVTDSLQDIEVVEGYLTYSTTYYWRVRYQDDTGWWSAWSTWTSFTTIGAGDVPHQPTNVSPANGTADIVLQPLLVSSSFATLNAVGTHAASQWQVTTAAGDFVSPLYDSNVSGSLITINVPSGVLTYNMEYQWRVRHQDSYGNWSAWSNPTSFTTIENLPPATPTNLEPVSGTTEMNLTPTLKCTAFSDPDQGDSQAAAQWQLTATAGDYSDPLFDSGIATLKLTEITVPVGTLEPSNTYYWHVRHQDSFGNWSAYSSETSFSTVTVSAPTAEFSTESATGVAGDPVIINDESVGATAWLWDLGDGTTLNWDPITRPRDGVLSHVYAEAGPYTVSLSVSNPAGTDNITKADFFTIAAVPKAAFLAVPAPAGENSQFTDVSSPQSQITSWTWNFGDGTQVIWASPDKRPEGGKISHEYSREGTFVASLTVKGPLGEHTINKQVVVEPGGGLGFEWWMLGAAAGALIVIGGGIYLFRGMKKKEE